jgi:hypothetical protein
VPVLSRNIGQQEQIPLCDRFETSANSPDVAHR